MNRLKELREEKKLSQKEIAKKIGVSYRTIQNWENGKSQIKPEKTQKLADLFGVSIGNLLGYEPESTQASNYQKIKICFTNGEELSFLVRNFTEKELKKITSQFNNGHLMRIRNLSVNPKNINYFFVDDFEENEVVEDECKTVD